MHALTPPDTVRRGTEPNFELERDALEVFLAQRPRLLRIAHRITGDAHWAEDCVQEAWLRWQLVDRNRIVNPPGFLSTTVAHLAINLIQAAGHRRESPSASQFDDKVGTAPDPVARAVQGAVAAQILGLLIARLTPAELAAYVLRKGFDYAYADIAGLLHTSIQNARQLIHRGQVRLADGRDRPVGAAAHNHLVAAFLTAERTGDLSGLERLLTQSDPMAASGDASMGLARRR